MFNVFYLKKRTENKKTVKNVKRDKNKNVKTFFFTSMIRETSVNILNQSVFIAVIQLSIVIKVLLVHTLNSSANQAGIKLEINKSSVVQCWVVDAESIRGRNHGQL